METGLEDISRLLDIRVGDIMSRNLVTADANSSIVDIARIMRDRRVSSVLITREGKVIGIITERDIVRRVVAEGRDLNNTKASDVMSSPIVAISEDAKLSDAALLMAQKRIRRLVIIDSSGNLVGIITTTDLSKYMALQSKFSNILFNALSRVTPPVGVMYG